MACAHARHAHARTHTAPPQIKNFSEGPKDGEAAKDQGPVDAAAAMAKITAGLPQVGGVNPTAPNTSPVCLYVHGLCGAFMPLQWLRAQLRGAGTAAGHPARAGQAGEAG